MRHLKELLKDPLILYLLLASFVLMVIGYSLVPSFWEVVSSW